MNYWYEMLYRPVSIGCQPKGIVEMDETKGVHGVVAYGRELTDLELEVYEMAKWEVAE